MIETSQSIAIDTDIHTTWTYVQDIRRWATLFPSCESCDVIDDNDSRWVIKVGAGGLVRTVRVHVHVDRWAGPDHVDFSFRLEAEPVTGSGSYTAVPGKAHSTDITLSVRIEGSGPMAPMWEAVCTPLLPQLAKTFAARLKAEVEAATLPSAQPHPATPDAVAHTGRLSHIISRLRGFLRSLFRSQWR